MEAAVVPRWCHSLTNATHRAETLGSLKVFPRIIAHDANVCRNQPGSN